MLREQERFQSLVRRYESPDEYAFFPDAVQKPILQPLDYPKILHDNDVNVNREIKRKYIEVILPRVCKEFGREDRGEKQENYGSAATCDVACLQALSRRIHFGKFVAESKFQRETERFVKLIRDGDRDGIDAAITNAKVEKKVLERLRLKARTYGTDPSIGAESEGKINVDAVVAMYEVSTLSPINMVKLHQFPLLMRSGNRDTVDKGGGSGVPDATVEGHGVGVKCHRWRQWSSGAFYFRGRIEVLVLIEVFLKSFDSSFKFSSFYQYHMSFWLNTKLLKGPLGI